MSIPDSDGGAGPGAWSSTNLLKHVRAGPTFSVSHFIRDHGANLDLLRCAAMPMQGDSMSVWDYGSRAVVILRWVPVSRDVDIEVLVVR